MRKVTAVALVLGPVGSATATYFWEDGRYGVTGGTILVLSMVVWTYGMLGLLEQVRRRLPRFGAVMLPVVLLGMLGGYAFGFQGFFEAVFHASAGESLAALEPYPVAANLLLWLPGPMMPVSLMLLGAGLGYRRVVPIWIGAVLCVAGALFPLSRIPRIDLVAHLADGLLVVAFLGLAWWYATDRISGRGESDHAPIRVPTGS